MKLVAAALALLLVLAFPSWAGEEMYTGAWWETVVRVSGDNKSGGAVDLALSGTEGTSGPLELKVFDRHVPQTFTGSWHLVRNSNTNLVKLVITNSFVDWHGTLNRAKGQVTGTWNHLPANRGRFQAARWYGLVQE